MQNETIFQFFHWYIRPEDKLWLKAGELAAQLSGLGITHVWLPPAYKSAKGLNEPGYAVYDLYDLGEFNQKDTIRTLYGTKEEYIAAINSFHENGISVLADIVLNHKHGADEIERMEVQEVNGEDRNVRINGSVIKEFPTRFTFPGRKNEYSGYVWNKESFTGISEENENVYLFCNQFTNGQWDEMIEDEKGNYDFLMGLDIEFRNPAVREELKAWGRWYIHTTGVDGFRLDALKHIQYDFFNEWLAELKSFSNKNLLVIGEYWKNDKIPLIKYSEVTNNCIHLFDVPLHYNFHEASKKGKDYDLRLIFENTLVQSKPHVAITFVDNHDTQPLQSLESSVEEWFKPLAYALILLRNTGMPCIFYPTLYGAKYWGQVDGGAVNVELPVVNSVADMIQVRRNLNYGVQRDYFDEPTTIGWTIEGIEEKNGSGLAVLMTTGIACSKRMEIGLRHTGKLFRDICNHCPEKVLIDAEGFGIFYVNDGSVSVWIPDDVFQN